MDAHTFPLYIASDWQLDEYNGVSFFAVIYCYDKSTESVMLSINIGVASKQKYLTLVIRHTLLLGAYHLLSACFLPCTRHHLLSACAINRVHDKTMMLQEHAVHLIVIKEELHTVDSG